MALTSALISQHLSSIPHFDDWCQEGILMLFDQLTDWIESSYINVSLSGFSSLRLVLKDHPLIHHFLKGDIEDTLTPFPQEWKITIVVSSQLNRKDQELLREYVHYCIEYTMCKMTDAFQRKLYHSSDWKSDMVVWVNQHIDIQTIHNPHNPTPTNDSTAATRSVDSSISTSDMYHET